MDEAVIAALHSKGDTQDSLMEALKAKIRRARVLVVLSQRFLDQRLLVVCCFQHLDQIRVGVSVELDPDLIGGPGVVVDLGF